MLVKIRKLFPTQLERPGVLRARMADGPVVRMGAGYPPRMDGFGVAQHIRSGPRNEQVTLVAVTGRSQRDDREAAAEAGFDFYFTNPATADQIRMGRGSQVKRSRSEL